MLLYFLFILLIGCIKVYHFRTLRMAPVPIRDPHVRTIVNDTYEYNRSASHMKQLTTQQCSLKCKHGCCVWIYMDSVDRGMNSVDMDRVNNSSRVNRVYTSGYYMEVCRCFTDNKRGHWKGLLCNERMSLQSQHTVVNITLDNGVIITIPYLALICVFILLNILFSRQVRINSISINRFQIATILSTYSNLSSEYPTPQEDLKTSTKICNIYTNIQRYNAIRYLSCLDDTAYANGPIFKDKSINKPLFTM